MPVVLWCRLSVYNQIPCTETGSAHCTSEEFILSPAFPAASRQAREPSIIAKCAMVFQLPAFRATGLDSVKQLQCTAHFHSEQMAVQQRS